MAYIPIDNSQVDPDSPVTAELMTALRDNPIEMFAGAAGAPRLQDAALGGTVTAAGNNWVSARSANLDSAWVADRYAGRAHNNVGTLVFAAVAEAFGATVNFGATIAGSNLEPNSANGGLSSTPLSGTWRCLGMANPSSPTQSNHVTLFIRIS